MHNIHRGFVAIRSEKIHQFTTESQKSMKDQTNELSERDSNPIRFNWLHFEVSFYSLCRDESKQWSHTEMD